MSSRVALRRVEPAAYPHDPPFDPPNPVYDAVVDLLVLLELDAAHAGTPDWNPFGGWVRPGGSIGIKPNFVTNRDRETVLLGEQLLCSSTHPAVLRAFIDLAWRALDGRGSLAVVDSPIEGPDIEDTVSRLGFTAMLAALCERGIGLRWVDLRDFTYHRHFVLDDTENFVAQKGKRADDAGADEPARNRILDCGQAFFIAKKRKQFFLDAHLCKTSFRSI